MDTASTKTMHALAWTLLDVLRSLSLSILQQQTQLSQATLALSSADRFQEASSSLVPAFQYCVHNHRKPVVKRWPACTCMVLARLVRPPYLWQLTAQNAATIYFPDYPNSG